MSQIGATTPLDTVTRQPGASQFGDLRSEDFIKIIFTELSNQDPFAPNDSAALLNQLSSIRSIESDMNLTRRLDSLVSENQMASASNLITRFVGGLTDDARRVSGFVVAVTRSGDDVRIELDSGESMRFSQVETVIDEELLKQFGNIQQIPLTPTPTPTPSNG